MFKLEAPMPTPQTTTFLPDPELGDADNYPNSVNKRRAMDGTRYSWVKSRDRLRRVWTFRFSKDKELELYAFLDAYGSTPIRATDHLGGVYLGYFTANPVEFESIARAAGGATQVDSAMYGVQLTYEGTLQG